MGWLENDMDVHFSSAGMSYDDTLYNNSIDSIIIIRKMFHHNTTIPSVCPFGGMHRCMYAWEFTFVQKFHQTQHKAFGWSTSFWSIVNSSSLGDYLFKKLINHRIY